MKPYVKKFENGILVNPITKKSPYLHPRSVKPFGTLVRFWQTVRNNYFTGSTVVRM